MVMFQQTLPPRLDRNTVFVIAEAGVNHNGSLDYALKLVEVAAAAGADAVKFQTFRADALATPEAAKAGYQALTTGAEENQSAMLRRLELDVDAHRRLSEACRASNITFMSTAFDDASLELLVGDLDVRILKVSSGDLTNGPFLLKLARTGRPVILSTGMGTLAEVEEALAVLAFGYTNARTPRSLEEMVSSARSADSRLALEQNVTILHCTSAYPAPASTANLRAMASLSNAFGLNVGYSDHTLGWHVTLAAVALGAAVIEKHFTLDRRLPGPDHRASLEPGELKNMIREIRDVSAALGDGIKRPMDEELENMKVGRRGIVAAAPLKAGDVLAGKLAAKRPAGKLSPMKWWDLQTSVANRDYGANESIDAGILTSGSDGAE